MRGEISSARFDKRHPLDWYVEELWVTEQLIKHVHFREELTGGEGIWDPASGFGTICSAFEGWGFDGRVYLSDVVDNVDRSNFLFEPPFQSADFLELTSAPAPCSIVCNPPYSYKKLFYDGREMLISEAFVRHALKLATRRVCMLLPIKWLSSQARFKLFMEDCPPAEVLVLTQRPSMPPGDRIELMGNRAFKGGMIDYCWIVWNVQAPTAPGQTRTVWLPPLLGAR